MENVSSKQNEIKGVQLIGTYNKTIQKDFSDGYTVFYFLCKGYDEYKKDGRILCAGFIPTITKGIPLLLNGYFEKDTKNRYLFNVMSSSPYSNKAETTCEYILNLNIKGIGPKTAEKIVSITGPDIFSYINQENAKEELLNSISEFKREKVEKLFEYINETHYKKDIYDFIKPFGGTFIDSQLLFDSYQSSAISKLKLHPYTSGRFAKLPFLVCDMIAKSQNIQPYDSERLEYLVSTAMFNGTMSGSTSMTVEDLYNNIKIISYASAFPEVTIPMSLAIGIIQKLSSIVKSKDDAGIPLFTLKTYDEAENVIAENIERIINTISKTPINLNKEIEITENKIGIQYSEKQKETFKFLKTSGIKILTGGPGTGKTTVIKGLIDMYSRLHPNGVVTLCAPTGRASQKIKEATGHTAFTIHKILNIKPYETSDEKIDYSDITPLSEGLIIIDEMSMVDLKLFAYIASALPLNSVIVLCGDTAQLPSVGPGNVFDDLIQSNMFDVVTLDVIHRQKGNSKIVELSQCIKNGDVTSFVKSKSTKSPINILFKNKEVQIVEVKDAENIQKAITDVLKNVFFNKSKKFYVDDILNIQILSPTKKGDAGTVSLNTAIKQIYHANHKPQNDIDETDKALSVGDKVMMMENNYDIGYYNGDVGIVKEIMEDPVSVIIDIDGEEYEIPKRNIQDISLAYACTVHKSQGSEYDYVLISLPKEPINMLQRNLLYTAVTRAKKYVAIVCEDNSFKIAVSHNDFIKRRTKLKEKIQKIMFN